MRPEDIKEWRDTEPFIPFRLCLTDGKSYDVPHRDFLFIARHVLEIGLEGDTERGIPDEVVRISPLHVVRIEHLKPA